MLDGIRGFRIDYKVAVAIIVLAIVAWIVVVRLTWRDAVSDFNQPIESPR